VSAGEQCLQDAKAPREPKANAPDSIDVSHILVRHAKLKRPEGATRSREEACLRALEALKKLQSSGNWDAVVAEYSDAPGATMGSLGRVSVDDLDPDFANAAFALDVDELSYVVETRRGFHIILRNE
jgi:parvulin-like peptidyl-prolyl isomerase